MKLPTYLYSVQCALYTVYLLHAAVPSRDSPFCTLRDIFEDMGVLINGEYGGSASKHLDHHCQVIC